VTALAVGIDAGGTKTLACWRGPEGDTHEVRLGGANVQRAGVDESARVLAEALQLVAAQSQRDCLTAVAGVAGAGREADQRLLRDATLVLLPARLQIDLRVTHDADIALTGAHGTSPGGLLLAGTGSIALMRDAAGTIHRAGGWGYLLGDEASGTRLGIEALRIALHTFDGGPPSLLVDLLRDAFDLDDSDAIVRRIYREKWPVQKAAPLLLRAAAESDPQARDALTAQCRTLAEQARLAARSADLDAPTLALAGGLMSEAPYREAISEALAQAIPACTVTVPDAPPVVGALQMAEGLT
jgi:N-acetylglucosamine kinase-like BadF-type ATPase